MRPECHASAPTRQQRGVVALDEEITVSDVHRWLANPEGEPPLLLDCRTRREYDIARLDDALLIPMHELEDRLDEIEAHRGRPIVVYCHHGRRSLVVTQALRRAGFGDVRSMAGGIEAWSQEIDPDVPRY